MASSDLPPPRPYGLREAIEPELIAIMKRALDNGVGVAVQTTNMDDLRRRFYVARKNAGNSEFLRLRFRPSPLQTGELWIEVKPEGE